MNLTCSERLKIVHSNILKHRGLKELEAWKSSEEGLRATIRALGKSQSIKEIKRLAKITRANNQKLWQEACALAWGSPTNILHKFGHASHLSAAEDISHRTLVPPPHYRIPYNCLKGCGWVLVKKGEVACPWCTTSLPEIRRTSSQNLDTFRSLPQGYLEP